MAFEAKLKAYREHAGMTQNSLARAAGVNPAFINRLESGERAPSNRELLERICDAMGLDTAARDDLLGSAGHLPDVYARVTPADPTLMRVAGVLADGEVSEDDKQAFRTVVEMLTPSEPALMAVAGVLGDARIPDGDRAEFRMVLEALCRRWRTGGSS